jgi:ubiquinone/menaquinone biosynthesis C-methylase UbiE
MLDDIRYALAPTEAEIRDLPLSSNGKIAAELFGSKGGRCLDIGCGDGRFTRAIAGLFKQASGIDIRADKIAQAQAAAATAGLRIDFRVGSGEEIPYAEASFEAVTFSNSLHHMPHPDIALREAFRVLEPEGLLYIMEPVPAGNYHEATKLVNDETMVRTQAYRELAQLPAAGMIPLREITYRARREFADFEEWRADQIDRDAKRRTFFDAQPDEVRRRFESSARREDGRLVFDQVFRANLLRKTAGR